MRIAGIALLLVGTAFAGQDADSPGLDVVVLSNFGVADHEGLLHLALDLLCRNAESTGVVHRVGVMSFGPALRLERPMTPIRRDALLQPERETRRHGDTGLRAAFAAAERIFRAVPSGPARRRAILVITDGPPVAGASASSVPLHLLLVNSTEADLLSWRAFAADRLYVLPRDRIERIAAAHRAISRLGGTHVVESRGNGGSVQTLLLPPYLDTVVFDVFGDAAGASVSVFAPDALQPLTAASEAMEEVRVGDALASVIVRRPAAGQWTFRTSRPDARVRVFSQQFFPRGVLAHPPQTSRQYDRVRIGYRVLDRDGRPLRELPGYPLSLQLTLTRPDGEGRTIQLAPSGNEPALFRTRDEVTCDAAGRYWTEVEIATRDLEGGRVIVFQDHWSGFSATPASLIECGVAGRNSAQHIEIECRDEKNAPADLIAATSGSPAALFRATLWHEERPAGALDLQYIGRGLLRAKTREPSLPGSHRVHLELDPSHVPVSYNVRLGLADFSYAIPRSTGGRVRLLVLSIVSVVFAVAVSFVLRRHG